MRNRLNLFQIGVLVTLFAAPVWAAQDLLRHLQAGDWEVVSKADVPPHTQALNCEWYRVRDWSGNEGVVFMLPVKDATTILLTHELAELLGVRHIPFYPTLVRRGRNGIPTRAELQNPAFAEKIFPTNSERKNLKIHLGDNEWGTGLYYPLYQVKKENPEDQEVITEMILQWLFLMVVGADKQLIHSVDGIPHYFFGLPFMKAGAYEYSHFKKVFDSLPRRSLQNMTAEQADELLQRVGIFFSRLKSVVEHHLRLLNSHLAYHQSGAENNIRSHLSGLKENLERYLQTRVGGKFTAKKIPEVATLPATRVPHRHRPMVNQSILELGTAQERKASARHILESFYFSKPETKQEAIASWAQALGTDDPIAQLLDEAKTWDGSVRLVGASSVGTKEKPRLEQLFLNRNLAPTVVVHPQSDRESETIHAILEETKEALPLHSYVFEWGSGPHLRSDDVEKILRFASDRKAQEIWVIECGGVAMRDIERITSAGYRLHVTDHHEIPGRSYWRPYSALEQFADRIGYRLAIDQHVDALFDRAGLLGLAYLGWSKNQARQYLREHSSDSYRLWQELQGIYDGRQGDVFPIITANGDSFSRFSKALSQETYPHPPKMMIVRSNSIVVSGAPEMTLDLHGQLSQRRDVSTAWGGDFGTSLFMVVRPTNGTSILEISEDMTAMIKNSPHLDRPCVIELNAASLPAR